MPQRWRNLSQSSVCKGSTVHVGSRGGAGIGAEARARAAPPASRPSRAQSAAASPPEPLRNSSNAPGCVPRGRDWPSTAVPSASKGRPCARSRPRVHSLRAFWTSFTLPSRSAAVRGGGGAPSPSSGCSGSSSSSSPGRPPCPAPEDCACDTEPGPGGARAVAEPAVASGPPEASLPPGTDASKDRSVLLRSKLGAGGW